MKCLKNLVYLFVLVFMISSCSKENNESNGTNVNEPNVEQSEINPLVNRSDSSSDEGLVLDCVTILFPFSLVDEAGSESAISSEDDFVAILDGTTVFIDFVYPLDLLVDGDSDTANDGEELGEKFASCIPQGGWEEGDFPAYSISYDNSCYTLDYPIQVTNLDGDVIDVADEDAFNGAIATAPVFFVFPLGLIHEDGTAITVNDIDEIFDALITCNGFDIGDSTDWDWDNGFEYVGCYLVEFPIDVVLADGTTVTVNDHMEYCDLMITGELVSYAYPLTLIDEDGNEVTVNDDAELEEILSECWDYGTQDEDGIFQVLILLEGSGPDGSGTCYSINYPVDVEYADGTSVSSNSDQELLDVVFQTTQEICCLVYPVDVTLVSNGDTVTFDGLQDNFSQINDCQ